LQFAGPHLAGCNMHIFCNIIAECACVHTATVILARFGSAEGTTLTFHRLTARKEETETIYAIMFLLFCIVV
jgi:hypothetical protein